MATVNNGTVPAERIVTLSDFVERVYLPWVERHKRPSIHKGYKDIWEDHLKPLGGQEWLKNTRTYVVQGWLTEISKTDELGRNSLRHVKSVISGIFTLAKQLDYFKTPHATRRLILGTLNPKKHMRTRETKCRLYSRCFPNPQQPRLQLQHSWGCGMARFKGYCGKTTATAKCRFPVQSEMGR